MQTILQSSRRPDIAFCRSGRIDIYARVVHILGLKPGDVIDIAFDPIRHEHYLYVRLRHTDIIGRHEGACFCTTRHGGTFRTHSRRLCRYIMQLHPTTTTLRLTCGEPETINDKLYLPLIIRHAI